MRTSLTVIALITTPVLLVACSNTVDEPIRGTVVEEEYEPAKTKKQKVDITERRCTTKNGKRTCRTVVTGTKTVTKTVKRECYELDIRLDGSDNVVEICDKAAYLVLDVEDRYSSAIDYSREKH